MFAGRSGGCRPSEDAGDALELIRPKTLLSSHVRGQNEEWSNLMDDITPSHQAFGNLPRLFGRVSTHSTVQKLIALAVDDVAEWRTGLELNIPPLTFLTCVAEGGSS
ncbi:hypothetical protein EVAR_98590_1 [Eumeta japonica]|uniref:Uncharacterized protein n=1 Tax=Eumeta variegata TaxID=151549 RepID=A0A4C1T695_EUMVA|nr:hypothetical protein EVAR_98590_1 [Eumeta japonica]